MQGDLSVSILPRHGKTGVMGYFVYILICRDGARRRTYVGWTLDPDRRLAQHNAGTGARSTRGRTWTLLHLETFGTQREAMSREWYLKRDRRLRKQLADAWQEAA